MAKITDFATLVAAIAIKADRADFDATDVEGFIQLAEDEINNRLRVRRMETEASITTDVEGKAALPSGYLAMKSLVDADGVPIPQTSPEAMLLTPALGNKVWTELGGEFRLAPAAVETLTAVYYQNIPALSSSNTTNWLLLLRPSIYLHACLRELAVEIENEKDIMRWDAVLTRDISTLEAAERRDRYSGPLAKMSPIIQVRGYRA